MGLMLETFDTATPPGAVKPVLSAEYLAGFTAGQAEAESGFQIEQQGLSAALVQSIADMAFGYEEAYAHTTAQLGPLFQALLEQLLPATLNQSLIARLHDIVVQAAQTDASHPVNLHVHPSQIESVKTALSSLDHPHLIVSGDPNLTNHAALTTTTHGETSLDLDAALTAIAGVFDALPQTQNRNA